LGPLPDEKAETNRFEISIPNGASLLITHSLDGRFPGLKDFAREDRPPVWGPFLGFRIMVGIGLLMILMALWGTWLWWRGRLEGARVYLRLASFTWPGGFIAVLAGWTVAEQGRQPWLAAGILRTIDAVSPVPAIQVLITLILFVVVMYFHFHIKMWMSVLSPVLYDATYMAIDHRLGWLLGPMESLRAAVAQLVPGIDALYQLGFLIMFAMSFWFHAVGERRVLGPDRRVLHEGSGCRELVQADLPDPVPAVATRTVRGLVPDRAALRQQGRRGNRPGARPDRSSDREQHQADA